MNRSEWIEHWQRGQIGFHLPEPNPQLVKHVGHLPPAPGRVLVPLSGKSHDLTWLAARGHETVGVEFVEQAARAYFAERGLTPEEVRAGSAAALRGGGVTLVVADLFSIGPADLGRFDAIYDRAALVAISPARRAEYVERLHALASDRAELLLLSLEHDLLGGPPFSVAPSELEALMKGRFALSQIDENDALEPRFRERGATRMTEHVWAGPRKNG